MSMVFCPSFVSPIQDVKGHSSMASRERVSMSIAHVPVSKLVLLKVDDHPFKN